MNKKDVMLMMEEREANILEYMKGLDPSSQEYKSAAETLKTIHDCKVKSEELEFENNKFDSEFDKWQTEMSHKETELDLQEKSLGVKLKEGVIEVAKTSLTVLGSVFTVWLTIDGYDKMSNKMLTFEKDGNIVTSDTSRGLLRNISLPHFGKK